MTEVAPVTLVVGPEELLVDRAVAAVIRSVRELDADADVRDLHASVFEPDQLSSLTSPSLFGERQVLVVRDLQQAPAALLAELTAYVRAPADDVTLVLVAKSPAKLKPLLDTARAAGATEVTCAEVKTRRDRLAFVTAEFRAAGRRVSTEVAETLLDAVGADLRALASACAQLDADTTGAIDVGTVRRYYEGRADVTGFVVADRAVEGRVADALVALRWALASGIDPVLIVAALAAALRGIVKVAVAPRGLRGADLAREVGMPAWKVDVVRRQLRGWDAEGIARALRAVAEADAQVKGAGGDPLYALERAVVAVATARTG